MKRSPINGGIKDIAAGPVYAEEWRERQREKRSRMIRETRYSSPSCMTENCMDLPLVTVPRPAAHTLLMTEFSSSLHHATSRLSWKYFDVEMKASCGGYQEKHAEGARGDGPGGCWWSWWKRTLDESQVGALDALLVGTNRASNAPTWLSSSLRPPPMYLTSTTIPPSIQLGP